MLHEEEGRNWKCFFLLLFAGWSESSYNGCCAFVSLPPLPCVSTKHTVRRVGFGVYGFRTVRFAACDVHTVKSIYKFKFSSTLAALASYERRGGLLGVLPDLKSARSNKLANELASSVPGLTF